VRALQEAEFEIGVNSGLTIDEVKARIEAHRALPARLLPLRPVWRGKQLEAGARTLADYTVTATTTIHLLEPAPER
jgi:hypothetical protein